MSTGFRVFEITHFKGKRGDEPCVGNDQKGVEGALCLVLVGISLLAVADPGELEAVEARLHVDMNGVLAGAAHQVETGGLGDGHRGADDDARNAHQLGDVVGLKCVCLSKRKTGKDVRIRPSNGRGHSELTTKE